MLLARTRIKDSIVRAAKLAVNLGFVFLFADVHLSVCVVNFKNLAEQISATGGRREEVRERRWMDFCFLIQVVFDDGRSDGVHGTRMLSIPAVLRAHFAVELERRHGLVQPH